MRIFHTAYRKKNPARRATLRGAKKTTHTDLVRILGRPRRNANPASLIKKRGLTKSVDAVNFLAELNQKIAELSASEGFDKKSRKANRKLALALIPLRDTVEASVEGYLSEDALNYSLEEAMRELTTAEVAAVQRLYKTKRSEEKKSLAEGRRNLTASEILEIQGTLTSKRPTLTAEDVRLAQRAINKQRSSSRRPLTAQEAMAAQHTLDVKRRRAKSEAKRRGVRQSELKRFESEGREVRELAQLDPEVIRAQKRVAKAEDLSKKAAAMFKAAIDRRELSATEWQRGSTRHEEIRSSQAAERKEIGDEPYKPKDKDLWARVNKAIKKKYPSGYIPPKLKSQKLAVFRKAHEKELNLLIEMSHASTKGPRKKAIRKALEGVMQTRLRNRTIASYEKMGGKVMTRREIQAERSSREAQKMQKLGTPFPVGPSFYGVIDKSGNGFKWSLIDETRKVHLSGTSPAKNSASRSVGKAFEVLENLVIQGDNAGWDNLSEPDRRWLEANHPKLSKKVARLIVTKGNIGKKKISKETILWLRTAADLGRVKAEESMAKDCKNMTIGEERTFKGKANAYCIHVQKGMRNKYTMWVVMKDGRTSTKRRLDGCKNAISRGHAIAGSLVGAGKVAKAVSNPGKIKRLDGEARKFFRKKNPGLPRQEAEAADIKELAGMFTIPHDSEEAFRYGLYFGIIRGIDTCGVQNFLKRKRIRKRYQERLLEGLVSEATRAGGIKVKPAKKSKKKPKPDADLFADHSNDEDLEALE